MTHDINHTLTERGARYGEFRDHAYISQSLKGELRRHMAIRDRLTLEPDQMEALEMICHKIARILNGDPNYADSWHDIAGYAQLVADRLNGVAR